MINKIFMKEEVKTLEGEVGAAGPNASGHRLPEFLEALLSLALTKPIPCSSPSNLNSI